jgi:hypothetical protein
MSSSEILDDPAAVRGIIYCVEHIATGKKYVGQTRSHRLNRGRYRPFGADGRFRDHMSCASRNTKTDQCSALYNAVREYGRGAFLWKHLEECDVSDLDDRERHWISTLNTEYPTGYNLTGGGRAGHVLVAQIGPSLPLNPVGKRGGCISRSAETRAKMKNAASVICADPAFRALRATNATAQHAAAKQARFAGVKIDQKNLDQYIFTKGATVFVRAADREASFSGKGNTKEDNINRAKEFLTSLHQAGTHDVITHVAPPQTATLPNCSGNP